jgi:hypothetical protein
MGWLRYTYRIKRTDAEKLKREYSRLVEGKVHGNGIG